ncbi:MAG: hypothetical protein EBU62_15685 [Proteobacteria bacterium]|nr:hypothetical protein [Pseudomonadota bacterium]
MPGRGTWFASVSAITLEDGLEIGRSADAHAIGRVVGGTVWGRMIGRWVANLRLEWAFDRRTNRSGVS